MKKRLLAIGLWLSFVMWSIAMLAIGYGLGLDNAEPQVVEVIKEVPVERIVTAEVLVEVPVEVIKEVPGKTIVLPAETVEVEKIAYKQTLLKEWESVDQFLDIFKGSIAGSNCLATARMIQEYAYKEGYIVNIIFLRNHAYFGKIVSTNNDLHAIVVIEVNNFWYAIDPNDWRVTFLYQNYRADDGNPFLSNGG